MSWLRAGAHGAGRKPSRLHAGEPPAAPLQTAQALWQQAACRPAAWPELPREAPLPLVPLPSPKVGLPARDESASPVEQDGRQLVAGIPATSSAVSPAAKLRSPVSREPERHALTGGYRGTGLLNPDPPPVERRRWSAGQAMLELQRHRWPLLGGMIGLLLDLLSKDLASIVLPGRAPLELFWGVRLVHRVNPGLLLGFFGKADPLYRQPLVVGLAVLALLCVPALVGFLVRSPRLRAWAVALISAGALGNLLERIWRAEVIDFLQIGPRGWTLPAFNLADLLILAGAGLVMLALLQRWRAASPHRPWTARCPAQPGTVESGSRTLLPPAPHTSSAIEEEGLER